MLRWWDGNQWTPNRQPVQPVSPPHSPYPTPAAARSKSRRTLWITLGAVFGFLFFVGIIASAVGGVESSSADDEAAETYTPPRTTTPLPPAPATPTRTRAPIVCDVAPDALVATIAGSLNDSSLSLGPAFSVYSRRDGLTYIGANIMRGDERESSADVWIEDDGAIYSMSSSAREYSLLPDGRDLLPVLVSAGDEYGSQVQTCAARGRPAP